MSAPIPFPRRHRDPIETSLDSAMDTLGTLDEPFDRMSAIVESLPKPATEHVALQSKPQPRRVGWLWFMVGVILGAEITALILIIPGLIR